MPRFLAVASRWYHRFHPPGLGFSHHGVGVVSPGLPANIELPGLPSVQGPGCNPPPCPRSSSTAPAYHGHPPPGAVCCSAPFCEADGLIAPTGPSPMRMNFDVAGIDHQPLKVWVVDDGIQQLGPDTPVPPAAKAAMGVLPISIVRRQVPPRRPSAQNPKYRVQKPTVVLGRSPYLPPFPGQVGLQPFPDLVRNIMPTMRRCHIHHPAQ